MSEKKFNVAIIGCGNIAKGYGTTLKPHEHIALVGAADLDPQRAVEFTKEFGGTAYESVEALLADPTVDLIINLTIHHAHAEIITQCLNAGKHVFSEKPLALTYHEANTLVKLAESKGLRLGCAPITFLGEAQQSAWKAIREGQFGTVRVAYAEVNWARIEKW
ncbi:MAG: Gfo/Idh/MocA family oxidoreductase, partial [Chitinophagaceae bacterium]|nr:Gfo/Idh/MocA family oxidoreductase [Anaerolineae bacterium]